MLDDDYKDVPIGLCRLDADLRYLRINDWLAMINGLTVEEHLGRKISDVLNSAAPMLSQLRQVLETGESLIRAEAYVETPAHPETKRYYEHSYYPDTSDDGTVMGIHCVVQDVTAHKQLEQDLQRSAERYQEKTKELEAANAALEAEVAERSRLEQGLRFAQFSEDHAADAIFWVKKNAEITYVSHTGCQTLGYSRQELLSKTVHDVDPGFPAEAWSERWEMFRREGVATVESTHRRKDGTVFPVEIVINFHVFDQVEYCCAFVRDITRRQQDDEERSRLSVKLQHTQKLESLGVLAGGIAHDFNNLLMGILGNAEVALIKLPMESPARKGLKNITKAALRAAELTSQMLAYSGKGQFVVEGLGLSNLVQEIKHLLRTSASMNVVLQYDLAENLPMIEADATQIQQVVMNLVINASEAFDGKPGVVVLNSDVVKVDHTYRGESYLDDLPEGDYVKLEVTDTGCGMDEETQQKMFDPFFSTKFTGRGLGLAAVLGIVRGHGGSVEVSSQPQRGTTVTVLFPASQLAVEESVGTSAPEQVSSGSGVILVVDDEEAVRNAAKMMLEVRGFTVLLAEDGRAALEIYRSRVDEIDVVLLDLTMPHMDGSETFRQLRRIHADVRVVISSGYNEEQTTERFAGKGLGILLFHRAGFIQKPYGVRELLESIRQALG